MDKKLIIIPAFILVVLSQWFVPAKMIWDSEEVLQAGVEYKFRTAPVDPYDPFRGKYVTLRFEANQLYVYDDDTWERGEEVYVILRKGDDGFAYILGLSKERPKDKSDFVSATVQHVVESGNKLVTVKYPFHRFYMEESKAYDAEVLQRDVRRDTSRITYALVSIKDGEAVLKDVMINDTSIVELVKIKQVQDGINAAMKDLKE